MLPAFLTGRHAQRGLGEGRDNGRRVCLKSSGRSLSRTVNRLAPKDHFACMQNRAGFRDRFEKSLREIELLVPALSEL
jgi:hypothetical protein